MPELPAWTLTTATEPWNPETEPEAQQHIEVLYDLYPARICSEDATYDSLGECGRGRVRAIVTPTKAYFFVEVPEFPGIGLLHSEDLVHSEGGKHDDGGILLEFADYSIRLLADKGCGCGSRLRTLKPFPSYSNISRF